MLGLDNLRDEQAVKAQVGVVLDETTFTTVSPPPRWARFSQSSTPTGTWPLPALPGQIRPCRQEAGQDLLQGHEDEAVPGGGPVPRGEALAARRGHLRAGPIVRDDILDILYDYIQDEGHSVFLSSHITGDLEKIADYITFITREDLPLWEKTPAGDLRPVPRQQGTAGGAGPRHSGGYRDSDFGVTALVKRYEMPGDLPVENATLDDLMLYSIKGKKPGKERR